MFFKSRCTAVFLVCFVGINGFFLAIYHLYIANWVIIYITYHLTGEPETTIDGMVLLGGPQMKH